MQPVDFPLLAITGLGVPNWPPGLPAAVYHSITSSSSRAHVYAPDQCGVGSLDSYADEAVRLVDERYRGERIVLVGHSLGGLIARMVARRIPSQVAKVITLGTPHKGIIEWAALTPFQSLRDMARGSRTIEALEADDPVDVTSMGSILDLLVPYRYQMVNGVRATNVCMTPRIMQRLLPEVHEILHCRAGHLSQIWRPPVTARVATEIRKLAMAQIPAAA